MVLAANGMSDIGHTCGVDNITMQEMSYPMKVRGDSTYWKHSVINAINGVHRNQGATTTEQSLRNETQHIIYPYIPIHDCLLAIEIAR